MSATIQCPHCKGLVSLKDRKSPETGMYENYWQCDTHGKIKPTMVYKIVSLDRNDHHVFSPTLQQFLDRTANAQKDIYSNPLGVSNTDVKPKMVGKPEDTSCTVQDKIEDSK